MGDKLAVRKTDLILEELEEMHEQVMRRAHEIFGETGGTFGHDLDDWLAAERELVWKPAIELDETDGHLRVRAAVAGLDAKDIDVEVDAHHVLVKGSTHHEHHDEKGKVHTCEFESGRLFRSIELPRSIDPDKVKAELRDGILVVTAKIAEEARAKKVEVESATTAHASAA